MNQSKSSCKIYSRNRLKIFKPKKYNRRHKDYNTGYKLIITIIIIAIIIYLIIVKSINPIFKTLCANEAHAIATKITNEKTSMSMQDYDYGDLFTIEKDENGNIQMINANVFTIDKLTSDVSERIQKGLEEAESTNVKLSIGSFTGIELLSGIGPQIPIKLSSTSFIDTELKSEFVSQGINQTLHKIYFQINCKVNILTPFEAISEDISNQLLIAENVIIGEIPNNYYNFEGLSNVEDMLNTVE